MADSEEAAMVSCLRRFVALAVPGRPRDCWVDPLLTHPRFPNAAAIIDAMRVVGVECAPVRAEPDQLNQLSSPSLLFLTSGEVAVLESVAENGIVWRHQRSGRQAIGFNELHRRWQGIALVVERVSAPAAGRACAGRYSLRPMTVVVTATVMALLVSTAFSATRQLATVLLVSHVAGLAASMLLESRSHGSRLHAALCPPGSFFDCNRVLDSPIARLGGLALTEWAAGYFMTCAIATCFALVAGTPLLPSLAWIAILALPVAVASLVAQVALVRAWCLGCLTIDAAILIQAAVLWRHRGPPDARSVATVVLALSVSVVVLAVRKFVPPAAAAERRRYLRMKRNPTVFAALLGASRRVPALPTIRPLLSFGVDDAPIVLTLVTNPYCSPCAYVHHALESLASDRRFQTRVLFLCDPDQDGQGIRVAIAAHALVVLSRSDEARRLVASWFAAVVQKRTFNDAELAPLEAALPADALASARASLRTQRDWALSAGIDATPFIAVNGRQMPPQYSLADLPELDAAEVVRLARS